MTNPLATAGRYASNLVNAATLGAFGTPYQQPLNNVLQDGNQNNNRNNNHLRPRDTGNKMADKALEMNDKSLDSAEHANKEMLKQARDAVILGIKSGAEATSMKQVQTGSEAIQKLIKDSAKNMKDILS